MANTEVQLLKDLTSVLVLLESLGLTVNREKSSLAPSEQVQFIGALLDSITGKAFLPMIPMNRASKIMSMIKQLLRHPVTSAHNIQMLLGHMAATMAVLMFAEYHMRTLQLWFLYHFSPQCHLQSRHLQLPPPGFSTHSAGGETSSDSQRERNSSF